MYQEWWLVGQPISHGGPGTVTWVRAQGASHSRHHPLGTALWRSWASLLKTVFICLPSLISLRYSAGLICIPWASLLDDGILTKSHKFGVLSYRNLCLTVLRLKRTSVSSKGLFLAQGRHLLTSPHVVRDARQCLRPVL